MSPSFLEEMFSWPRQTMRLIASSMANEMVGWQDCAKDEKQFYRQVHASLQDPGTATLLEERIRSVVGNRTERQLWSRFWADFIQHGHVVGRKSNLPCLADSILEKGDAAAAARILWYALMQDPADQAAIELAYSQALVEEMTDIIARLASIAPYVALEQIETDPDVAAEAVLTAARDLRRSLSVDAAERLQQRLDQLRMILVTNESARRIAAERDTVWREFLDSAHPGLTILPEELQDQIRDLRSSEWSAAQWEAIKIRFADALQRAAAAVLHDQNASHALRQIIDRMSADPMDDTINAEYLSARSVAKEAGLSREAANAEILDLLLPAWRKLGDAPEDAPRLTGDNPIEAAITVTEVSSASRAAADLAEGGAEDEAVEGTQPPPSRATTEDENIGDDSSTTIPNPFVCAAEDDAVDVGPDDNAAPPPVLCSPPVNSQDVEWLVRLLREGNYAHAFWLTRALGGTAELGISADVLGAFALSLSVGPGDACPAKLERFLDQAYLGTLSEPDRLLLAAPTIASALFNEILPGNVWDLVQQGAPLPQVEEIYGLLQRARRSKGLHITRRDVDSALAADAVEAEFATMADNAESFLQRIPSIGFMYKPAQRALRYLYREGSSLRLIHEIVSTRATSRMRELKHLLDDIDAATLVDDLVGDEGLPDVYVTIVGAPREKLRRFIDDTVTLGRRWSQWANNRMSGGPGDAYRTTQIAELKAGVERLATAFGEELLPTYDAIADAARSSFRRFVVQLQQKLTGLPDSPAVDLTLPLLGYAGVALDEDFEPLDEGPELAAAVRAATAMVPQDMVFAWNQCIKRGEFLRARRLVDLFALGAQRESDTRDEEDKRYTELTRRIEEAADQIEDAYLLGELPFSLGDGAQQQTTRARMLEDLGDARQHCENRDGVREVAAALDKIFGSLEQIAAHRRERIENEARKIEAQFLDTAEGESDRSHFREELSRCLEARDDVAASEWLERAKAAVNRSEPITRAAAHTSSEFASFTYRSDAYFETLKADRTDIRVADMIRSRQTIAGVTFGSFDAAHLGEAARGLDAWSRLRTIRFTGEAGQIATSVVDIAQFLGFRSKTVRKGSVLVEEDFAHAELELESKVGNCPVPAFGSLLGLSLDVVVCRVQKDADQIADFVRRRSLRTRSILLLYLLPARRQVAQKIHSYCVRNKLTILMVDMCMALHLAGHRNRLPVLFEIGLPFCWTQPYMMKGENVPQETFVGREEEVRSLFDPQGSCVVFGGRQLGKSATLRHITRNLHDRTAGIYVAYIDIDDLGAEPQTHEEMKTELWRRIFRELAVAGFFNEKEMPIRGVAEKVEAILRQKLSSNERLRVILLLDESDDLLDLDSTLDFPLVTQFRNLMAVTQRHFKVVFAGLQSVQRYTNWSNHPFAQLGSTVVIRPLPPRQAQDLVVKPFGALGFVFSTQRHVLRILSQTNYHPGLIQIFCHRLLENLWSKTDSRPAGTLQRAIELDDILRVERNPEFLQDIRDRFDWTLDLDQRYKVLTYALALSGDPSAVRTEQQFMELGRSWWPAVFGGMDSATLRAVLNEMDGLGVLIHESGEGVQRYRLGSPNILRLLGSRDHIEANFLWIIEQKALKKKNPRNYHSRDLKTDQFSPLTREQEALVMDYRHAPFTACLVAGSRAQGLDLVPDAFRRLFESMGPLCNDHWTELTVRADHMPVTERLLEDLHSALRQRERMSRFFFIDAEAISLSDSIDEFAIALVDRLAPACSSRLRGYAVILVPPSISFIMAAGPRSVLPRSVKRIQLHRWSDGAVTRALEETGLQGRTGQLVTEFMRVTGGIHELVVDRLHGVAAKQKNRNAQVDVSLADKPLDLDLAKLGLNQPGLVNFLAQALRLASIHDDTAVIDAEDLALVMEEYPDLALSVTADGGSRLRRWLETISLADVDPATGTLRFPLVVHKLLTNPA